MPKIDIPVKRLFQIRPADWVRYVQPDCREEWVVEFKTDFTPKKESRLDSVLEIGDPDGPYLMHFEPMGYLDRTLPARMLRYRADIWESTLSKGLGTPSIRQVVIFFYEEDDNGVHRLSDKGFEYTFTVIKVWEERRQSVIEAGLVGLYPLLPLMRGDQMEEKPEDGLKESIEVARDNESKSLTKQDLLAAMAIFAEGSGKFPKGLVTSLIRRDMIMESTIFQEWTKEERAEGVKEGKMETARAALKKGIPEETVAEITGLDQETILKLKAELN
jgi:predicted transposase/invertase (TIGR01784 family)